MALEAEQSGYFTAISPIERLPYVMDAARLAFRSEGKGFSGGREGGFCKRCGNGPSSIARRRCERLPPVIGFRTVVILVLLRTPNDDKPTPLRCVIIAGPNGAGKTTFAREFLPRDTDVVHFVNADLIAAGLSALKPEIAAVTAGRVFLAEIDRLAAAGASFAFETTFGGRAYAARLARWKLAGYRTEIVYLMIDSPQIALKRIASRVKEGGARHPSRRRIAPFRP